MISSCYHICRLAGLKGKPITFRGQIDMLAFCVFEVCVGIFWPSMMTMRATYVPEELRATIINMFRIPLNAFVCVVLANVSMLEIRGGALLSRWYSRLVAGC
eukprot:GHUV01041539.1.p1 GENE.GHUV01041539.1~~GHUV01041539.1.p1  ORF type:complete len:102 (-),score=2.04 GHUV01041539.1:665-970(-)